MMKRIPVVVMIVALCGFVLSGCHKATTAQQDSTPAKLYAIGLNLKAKKIGQFKYASSERWDASWTLRSGNVTFDAANKTWNITTGGTDHIRTIPVAAEEHAVESGVTITGIEFTRTQITVRLSDGSTISPKTYLSIIPRILKDGRCIATINEFKPTGHTWQRLWSKCYVVE